MQAARVESQGKRRRIVGQNLNGALPLGKNIKIATTCNKTTSRKTDSCGDKKNACSDQDYQKRRDFRAYLALRQRQEVIRAGRYPRFKALCGCSQYAVPFMRKKKDGTPYFTGSPGEVQFVWHEDGGLSTTWAQRCSSPMLCFECAPKIRHFRSVQLQTICRRMYEAGYSWQFWTFTAPHDLNSDPDDQVELFRKAYRLMIKDRRWRLFRDRVGQKFTIVAVEMTDDGPDSSSKSGCHFHYHVIVFFDHPEFLQSEADEMRAFVSRRWVDCLLEVGLISSERTEAALKIAFRLDVPRKPQKKPLKRRLTDEEKQKILQDTAAYIAKGASCELTPGIFTKKGRVASRISHWDLMALAFTTRPGLVPRALAVMQALKGRHWLTFSPGLLAFCGLKDLSDEDILKQTDDISIHSFDEEEWKTVSEFRSRARLVRKVTQEALDCGLDLVVDRPSVDFENRKFFPSDKVDRMEGWLLHALGILEAGRDPITEEKLAEGQAPSWVRLE